MQQQTIDAVARFLKDVSRQTEDFARATGMQCKSGCGKCCDNPNIEATVTEMLPMAQALWQSGRAREFLHNITKQDGAGVCVMYKRDPLIPGNGRCLSYEYRPGICRLFGFAAKRNAAGQKELVTCRVFKDELTSQYHVAQKHIAGGGAVPSAGEHTLNVFAIDPQYGNRLMPINQALRIALQLSDGLGHP